MKSALTFCLLAALLAFTVASSASWGRRNATDYLLYREEVLRYPIKNNYWSVNVNYPYAGSGYKVITAVYVYDRFTNTSGAIPTLYSGGPRHTFATINLKSQYARGIKSTVEIYGK